MTVLSVLLALVLTGVEPQNQALQTPDPNRIKEVNIIGNVRIRSNDIKYRLQTKQGDLVNPAVIARDVRELNAMNSFDNIKVEEEDTPTGVIVTFRVKEKRLIRTINYEGLKSIT